MSKIVRVLTVSLILTVILIVSLTGIVFADGGKNPEPGTCPNPNCPNPEPGICPNPDCLSDCLNNGDGSQIQSQVCTSTCNQTQFNNKYGAEGNCYSRQHCKTNQYMWGVESE